MSRNNNAYFDKLATEQRGKKRTHTYYWRGIIDYCNYFAHEDLSILEVGCGTGELLHALNGKRKVGIDFSEKMIQNANLQHPDILFYVMPAEQIEINEKFDLIILSNLIGYLDDVQKVFEQLHKVCHSRTKIIVTYFNYLWEPLLSLSEFTGFKRRTPTQNWLTLDDINNLLEISGFDVYRNATRTLLPIKIPLLSSFCNRFLVHLPIFNFFSLNIYSFAKPKTALKRDEFELKYSVSIVIPARNESGNIENAILRLPTFASSLEIIFVEGNSTDDTWTKINEVQRKYSGTHNIKTIQQEGKGKADAVRKGFSIATGDILIILDADLTVPPEDLPKFYDAIASENGDFINGCRLVYPMEKQAMRFLNLLGNKFFSRIFTWLLDQKFKDTLCGTKVMFREDYIKLTKNQKYFGNFDPFGDFDLIFGAHKLNHKIVEVPIRYRDRIYGTTNISRFKHGFILLRMCLFALRKIKFI